MMLNDKINEDMEQEDDKRIEQYDNNEIPGRVAIGVMIFIFAVVVILYVLRFAKVISRPAVGIISLVILAAIVAFFIHVKKRK